MTHGPQAEVREAETDEAADEPDDAGFDEELEEDRSLRGTEGAPDSDLGRPSQELRQQKADRVDEAYEQEAERDPRLQARIVRDDLVFVEPLHHVRERDVRRSLEVADRFLLQRVADEEVAICGNLGAAIELDPEL